MVETPPQAARDAGYNVGKPDGWSKDSARHVASALLKRPVIREALRTIQANTTKELGDLALTMRISLVNRILDDGPDLVQACGQLAKMTPGALVPAEVKVDAKMTYADMVLAAQRKREGESAVVTGNVAEVPILPDVEPAR
jgi:phage terminase small subunit